MLMLIASGMYRYLFGALADLSLIHIWKNVVEISPVLSRLETNPQFAQVIAPSDMIAIVTLNMKIGDVEGMVNICLPFFTLEDVMDKLNTKYWFSTMQEKDVYKRQVRWRSLRT